MAELLKEAIADAKAVREVALQNAKMALEEAFDSKLKSMLSAKLAEEIEEDVELEETYDEDEKSEGVSYEEDDKDVKQEEFDLEEDLDEEINLDELMAELEEMSDDVTEGDDFELEEGDEGDLEEGILDKIKNVFKSWEEKEVGEWLTKQDKSAVTKAATDDSAYEDLVSKMQKDIGERDGDTMARKYKALKQLVQNKELNSFITQNPTGLVSTLAMGEGKKPEDETNESFDIDALVAEIEAEIEEGKKDKEEEVKEAYGDSPGKATGPAKGKPGAPFGDGKSGKGSTGYDGAVKQLKEERDAALETVTTLKETISEMNLLNSKLLYCNKLFRANALTEAQKVKVVDALDKATTTGEAKLVFETLQESFNFTGVEKRAIKEGLARASKPVGTAPKKVLSESVDETVSRFQKLANINK